MNINYLINAIRILGLLLMPFSATMLPPILVALWYHENTLNTFLLATSITLSCGLLLWFPLRRYHREIHARETFLIVTVLWIVLSLTGALPFAFADSPHIPYIDAVFETISGLTTTGSSVISHLDNIPRSILYYRQQLQFIGGGGIIVLSIAILPMLGVGGMQLFRAEMTGPFKEDKLTPRVAQTAKTLWFIYVGLVIVCAFSYWLGGMSIFDAICYSFGTISTGGFSTHDDSFMYFHSPLLETLCTFFMLLGAINFYLHFAALQRKSLLHYWQDPELRTYLYILAFVIILITGTLLYKHVFENSAAAFLKTAFQVISFSTTTGFFSTQYNLWPSFIPPLFVVITLLGGCAGSTSGGFKVIRLLVLKLLGGREIQRLIHPNGHYVIKLGMGQLHHRTLDSIVGFFCLYVATYLLLFLLLVAMGLDYSTAFSSIGASIANTGIGIGVQPEPLETLSDPVKIVMCFAMLAGRLELFTFLVLLTPSYWRY